MTNDRHHIVSSKPDDIYILDSQSCQVVTFVTHKIFANWPDVSAGRKVPFVVDRRSKSLFPNGSRHSAPFRPAAVSHDWRHAEGKKGGGEGAREPGIQSAFNIDSNPISWISIFVIYFLRRQHRHYLYCERGCFSRVNPNAYRCRVVIDQISNDK